MTFILAKVTETQLEENGVKSIGYVHEFAIKPKSIYNKVKISAGIIQILSPARLAIKIGDEYKLGV